MAITASLFSVLRDAMPSNMSTLQQKGFMEKQIVMSSLFPVIGNLKSSNKFSMIEVTKKPFFKPTRVKFKQSNRKKLGKFPKTLKIKEYF